VVFSTELDVRDERGLFSGNAVFGAENGGGGVGAWAGLGVHVVPRCTGGYLKSRSS